ncbi:hypothetical protein ACG7TL_005484 [Trametes sanguinea]
MSPNVTRKRGGPKKGQRCSNPKIPKVLAELGVQGFGCLEPSRSTPGTLQDAYDLDHTRPTSKKPTFSVNIPSQPHIAPRRRDNCKNKSRSAQRNAGRAPRNAARTSASRLKTSHPRVPDTEDDTKSFVPDIVGTQPHRLEVPAPTGDSTQHPAGHLSSQPETLQLAKSPSSQGQSHTVHHPPLFGTPSQAAAKTSSPPHAKKAQSVREPAPDMSMGSVAGGVEKLKTLQPGVPDAEDDTKSFMPRVWDPPAPTEGSMHYPVGHPSSQPEILQRAKSRSFQAESSIVHDPPLGTPSHITSKTSSPPHAREAQSNRETASDMSIGTVPGGVARHERTHHRTQASPLLHLRDSPTSDGLQHGGGSAAGLPSAAFYANRLMSLHDSAGLAQMQALHDTAALSGAPHNAAHSNLEHTLLQTSSFGIGAPYLYGALVMDSALVPHHPANTKSNLSTFSVLAQALGSSTTSSIS